MSELERDPYTGYLTTGHEWNGIKELNTPVPRPVYVFLIATALFGVLWWVLMPAWPIGVTYTKGVLGVDQRQTIAEKLQKAALERSAWSTRIEKEDFAAIQSDASLMTVVRQTGPALFGDNCAACHGAHAGGGKGYPDLTTPSWLWGGTPEAIAETIRVGINSEHPDTRASQMPAFGHDQMLPGPDIENVVAYVRSLSKTAAVKSEDGSAEKIEAGKKIFAENCSSCHGDDGRGNVELGAPNLTDSHWIYGGDPASILTTVWNGRQGHMPTWEARLPLVDRKILALYLVDLRKKDK